MGFDPCNCALKIQESIWDSNSQHGSSLGNVKVHSRTLFTLLGACDVIFGSPSWPATLQPLTLVVSPRLGLRHCEISLRFQPPTLSLLTSIPVKLLQDFHYILLPSPNYQG
jgi:hypothetical protein